MCGGGEEEEDEEEEDEEEEDEEDDEEEEFRIVLRNKNVKDPFWFSHQNREEFLKSDTKVFKTHVGYSFIR